MCSQAPPGRAAAPGTERPRRCGRCGFCPHDTPACERRSSAMRRNDPEARGAVGQGATSGEEAVETVAVQHWRCGTPPRDGRMRLHYAPDTCSLATMIALEEAG